tara:strand:- start:252 stop:1376 length:1125 start_codon:yes stop_codon:yes gene_type:complete
MDENKFTVKEVTGVEKSRVEVEEELLQKHEEQFEDSNSEETTTEKVEIPEVETKELEAPAPELNDADVLSYIKNRYDRDIDSVEQLFETKESNVDLPEDVSAYFKYKKETGRGIEDFVNLQKDYDNMDGNTLLSQYYSHTEEGLDSEDIKDLIEDKFNYDEDVDEESDIKKIERAKKRELAKARKFFNEQKDKYKIPLESSGGGLSDEQTKEMESYKSYIKESNTAREAQKKKYDYFLEKTDEVFNDEFKGFEFKVGEKSFTFKPGDSNELKSKQSDVNNFVSKFMDKESGLIADPQGYHRAISVAMNLDKFAEFFYNQGMTEAVDNVSKKSKNINMDSIRKTPENFSKDGLKIRNVGDSSSGKGLRIRSIKKK